MQEIFVYSLLDSDKLTLDRSSGIWFRVFLQSLARMRRVLPSPFVEFRLSAYLVWVYLKSRGVISLFMLMHRLEFFDARFCTL